MASPEPGATDGGFSKAGKLMKDKNPIELMKIEGWIVLWSWVSFGKETSRPILGSCRQLALANGIDALMILP